MNYRTARQLKVEKLPPSLNSRCNCDVIESQGKAVTLFDTPKN